MIIGKELAICSVSGGKDSTALYCLMIEQFGQEFLPIFADTGNEHPITVNYVRNLHLMAHGPKIKIVTADFKGKLELRSLEATGNPFLDMMLWKGRTPSSKAQFCTEWVKLWPILLYLQKYHQLDDWVMYAGIRQAESLKRKLRYHTPFFYNEYFDCEYILPLLYESEEDVFSYLETKNVPPNPLYALGFSRVGCYPCIHSNKEELNLLPDWAWNKLEKWESKLGRSWFPSGILPSKPKGYIPSIKEVRLWCKTLRGGKKFDLFKSIDVADVPSCLSTWGVCE